MRYRLTDAQGSTRFLTNALGAVTSSYVYDAFGTLQSAGTPETKYLYTGQQFDQNTGLYSLRARMYNPNDGRFLSMDTWRYNLQNPIELNRYAYTANNPINWSDPSGHMAIFERSGTERLTGPQKHALRQMTEENFKAKFWAGFRAGILGWAVGKILSNLLFRENAFTGDILTNIINGMDWALAGIVGGFTEMANFYIAPAHLAGQVLSHSARFAQGVYGIGAELIGGLTEALKDFAMTPINVDEGYAEAAGRMISELLNDFLKIVITGIIAGAANGGIKEVMTHYINKIVGLKIPGLGTFLKAVLYAIPEPLGDLIDKCYDPNKGHELPGEEKIQLPSVCPV